MAVDQQDERDFQGEMIAWLTDKPQDVWLYAARHLNWDNAVPILQWMISQPQCDRAVAAWVLWHADPAGHLHADQGADGYQSEELALIEGIITNWDRGFYRLSDLQLDLSQIDGLVRAQIKAAQRIPSDRQAFSIPLEFFGPFDGRVPRIPKTLHAEKNKYLWDLFFGLGTEMGYRPETTHPIKNAANWWRREWNRTVAANYPLEFETQQEASAYLWGDSKAKARRRRQVMRTLMDRLYQGFRPLVLYFLVFFVATMTIAIVMRRINFGIWF